MKDWNFFTELKHLQRLQASELAISFVPCGKASPLFEIALMLVRLGSHSPASSQLGITVLLIHHV